jgi:ferredoxin
VGYRFQIDRSNCLNCGVCMDVCPVQALDMTRTLTPTIEAGVDRAAGRGGKPFMMEFPLQSVVAVDGPVEVAGPQGPILRGPGNVAGWGPLSAYTRESLKEVHSDPWGSLTRWRATRRPETWQVWRTWTSDEEAPDRLVAPCQEACPVGTGRSFREACSGWSPRSPRSCPRCG